MKVTTKRGDRGYTDLFGGRRVAKSTRRIKLIGLTDEAQAFVGLAKAHLSPHQQLKHTLTTIQQHLYLLMAELSCAQTTTVNTITGWTAQLENTQTALLKKSAIGNKFVIPGETVEEATIHVARARVRTLERELCAFAKREKKFTKYIPYVNRASDFLFVISRFILQ